MNNLLKNALMISYVFLIFIMAKKQVPYVESQLIND
jgi:hypothetical protein